MKARPWSYRARQNGQKSVTGLFRDIFTKSPCRILAGSKKKLEVENKYDDVIGSDLRAQSS